MKELFLLRHGNTGYFNQYIGATDVALSTKGVDEIFHLRQYLSDSNFDNIICSPLKRCRQTCEILGHSENILFDDRIKEVHFGRWEKKTFAEIEASDPELVNQWAKEEPAFQFPEGEKLTEFLQRITDFSQYIQSLKGNKLLIISHGGVIRHLICNFLNISHNNYLYFQIKPGMLTTINLHNRGGVMTGMNIGGKYNG